MRHLLLIMRKKAETTLNDSYFQKIMSNITLNFISNELNMLTNCFFKLQGIIMNLGNKLTVFQRTVCEIILTKIYT